MQSLDHPAITETTHRSGSSPPPSTLPCQPPVAANGTVPVIKGYQLLKRVGRGAMGAVYLARQESLGREVAIKVLAVLGVDALWVMDRFHREARAIARLKHPNIVPIYDFGETDGGLPYYAMEYVEGNTLADVIGRREPLPVSLGLGLVRQICGALEYAHAVGIVHRDIKPANILLDPLGNAKVADFGLARLLNEEENMSRTMPGVIMGTPNYMAPEQAKDSGQADHRADLYSVGVVLYEMLTGELPAGSFKLPSQKNPSLDAQLDKITQRALEPRREERYQSASAMRADLEEVIDRLTHTRDARLPHDLDFQKLSATFFIAARRYKAFLLFLGAAMVIWGISSGLRHDNAGASSETSSNERATDVVWPNYHKLVVTGTIEPAHAVILIDGRPLDRYPKGIACDTTFPLPYKIHAAGYEDLDGTITGPGKDGTVKIMVSPLKRSAGEVSVRLPSGGLDYTHLILKWQGDLLGNESAQTSENSVQLKLSSDEPIQRFAVPTGRYEAQLGGAEPRLPALRLSAIEVKPKQTLLLEGLPETVARSFYCAFELESGSPSRPIRIQRHIQILPGLTAGSCTETIIDGPPGLRNPANKQPYEYPTSPVKRNIMEMRYTPRSGISGRLDACQEIGAPEERFIASGDVITFENPFANAFVPLEQSSPVVCAPSLKPGTRLLPIDPRLPKDTRGSFFDVEPPKPPSATPSADPDPWWHAGKSLKL